MRVHACTCVYACTWYFLVCARNITHFPPGLAHKQFIKHVLPALPLKKTKFHAFADCTPFTLNPQNSIPAQIGAGKSYFGGIYIQWATLL